MNFGISARDARLLRDEPVEIRYLQEGKERLVVLSVTGTVTRVDERSLILTKPDGEEATIPLVLIATA
jgi:hypothetical protein